MILKIRNKGIMENQLEKLHTPDDAVDFLEENKDNLQFAEPTTVEELYAKFIYLKTRGSDTDDPYLIGINEGIEAVLTDLKKIVKL